MKISRKTKFSIALFFSVWILTTLLAKPLKQANDNQKTEVLAKKVP